VLETICGLTYITFYVILQILSVYRHHSPQQQRRQQQSFNYVSSELLELLRFYENFITFVIRRSTIRPFTGFLWPSPVLFMIITKAMLLLVVSSTKHNTNELGHRTITIYAE